MRYVGRFAPSPTGPLHLGSLYAAVCSYLDARAHHGKWLLRIEDIDPPREVPGASDSILDTLKRHDLFWDGDVTYQSGHSPAYESTLNSLMDSGACFACPCSRKELKELGRHTDKCPLRQNTDEERTYAIRLKGLNQYVVWQDLFLGQQSCRCIEEAVLKRRDGLYSYQLAVVVDDISQGVTHVVRGKDLLDCTPTQLHLYDLLKSKAPSFGHIPLVINERGQKLSKQNLAPAINPNEAIQNLLQVGVWLGFSRPSGYSKPGDILDNYIEQWARSKLKDNDLLY